MPAPMYGSCGLVCSECPAYVATQASDQAKAEATAKAWSQQFGIEVKVEHVWCDGCRAPGRKCAHCAECEIRSCATGRNLATCAPCADYPCKQLQGFFAMAPMAKTTLDQLRCEG
jgi:hypothetical protein